MHSILISKQQHRIKGVRGKVASLGAVTKALGGFGVSVLLTLLEGLVRRVMVSVSPQSFPAVAIDFSLVISLLGKSGCSFGQILDYEMVVVIKGRNWNLFFYTDCWDTLIIPKRCSQRRTEQSGGEEEV